jgi:hypothetical protein
VDSKIYFYFCPHIVRTYTGRKPKRSLKRQFFGILRKTQKKKKGEKKRKRGGKGEKRKGKGGKRGKKRKEGLKSEDWRRKTKHF